MIRTKIVSSLEKARPNDRLESFAEIKSLSCLKGERVSFQLLHTFDYEKNSANINRNRAVAALSIDSPIEKYVNARDVHNVAVSRPTLWAAESDDGFISMEPGLFPDLLMPLNKSSLICITRGLTFSIWIDLELPKDIAAGQYSITLTLTADDEQSQQTLTLDIIDAALPDESIYFTQWFHCDSLATHYNVEMFSERHWEIIENFARVAVKNGINLLLTPVFTPPLDTERGGERPTCQLVRVNLLDGEYSFDFTLLKRWIAMCDRVGIKYFEISHLFTQWGAAHAPKIMATVDGEYRRIFGWDTDSTSPEYVRFLRIFLSELLAFMKSIGRDKDCFFHMSDEPGIDHIDKYLEAKSKVSDLLEGYTIMDALSKFDYYERGVVETPIPANNHIAPFIEANIKGLWTYYCCSQINKVSNRFLSTPSARNRSIGFQMFKYDIVGFLHWGYNFYFNYLSRGEINPFVQQDGNAWVTPGDAYSVYPGTDGEPLESIRLLVFYEALEDLRAMRLCAKYYGKDRVVEVIEKHMKTTVTFDTCAYTSDIILGIREEINSLIRDAVSN